MGLFNKSASKNNAEGETESRRPSVRDLQARAFNVWNSATYSMKRSQGSDGKKVSGFEAERARRASQSDNGAVVMRH